MYSGQNDEMKKILLISENSRISAEICTLISDTYIIFSAESLKEGADILERNYTAISAILVDSTLAAEKGKHFLTVVSEEPRFMFIPIILLAATVPANDEIECLRHGAVDIVVSPFHKRLTEQRINNAIRLKDSASFYEIEKMLKVLPSNIFLKDTDCRYIFATKDWYQVGHENDPDWTIRGKTDMDIRHDTENAFAAIEADKEIMRTGKGTSYVVKVGEENEEAEYFDIIKEPVMDKERRIRGVIGIIHNVTAYEKLRRKLKTAADTDGLTGLLNRRKIQSRIRKSLNSMNERGSEKSLIMLDIDNFKNVNDTYGHNAGDMVLKGLAGILMDGKIIGTDEFYAGRWGGEEFMVILKDAGVTKAKIFAENIRAAFCCAVHGDIPQQTISLGVTQMKNEDTVDTLCSRVDKALYIAKKSGKNRVEVI